MDALLGWLLEGPAFVRYRALVELEGRAETDAAVKRAYREMLEDPLVAGLLREVNGWGRQRAIKRHNDAVHPLHRLAFAASIGVKRKELKPAIEAIQAHQAPEGPFQVRIEIPKAFGGTGKPKWDWVATDAPLVLYALLRLGVNNTRVRRGVDHLLSRIAEPGFPCFASPEMGKFKGPGPRRDPCPYANLIMLRMLAQLPERLDSEEAERAVGMLLHHWEVRGQKKYFLFGIGTDFAKPKAPRIWYDVIHFVDVLSRFPSARADERFHEAATLLRTQLDANGRVAAQSIWAKWKGWEFCQKKEPSRWLTFLCHRALRRLES